MIRPLRVAAPAGDELSEAVRWYESQRSGLGAEFLEAVAQVLDAVGESPGIGSPVVTVARGRLRRRAVTRFPYHAIYEAKPSEIVVVAFAHAKRRPGYWQARL